MPPSGETTDRGEHLAGAARRGEFLAGVDDDGVGDLEVVERLGAVGRDDELVLEQDEVLRRDETGGADEQHMGHVRLLSSIPPQDS